MERSFWRLIAEGLPTKQAALSAGVASRVGGRWFAEAGGMAPMDLAEPSGRYLTFAEREEIALGRAAGQTMTAIAARLGRPTSAVSRELARYQGAAPYKASVAQRDADERARRPQTRKLAGHPRLRTWVQESLESRADRRPAG